MKALFQLLSISWKEEEEEEGKKEEKKKKKKGKQNKKAEKEEVEIRFYTTVSQPTWVNTLR